MRDVMNHIAMRLGWNELKRPHTWGSEADVWRQDETTDKPLLTTDNPVVFAAYAKAAMAKRGWTPFSEGDTVAFSIQFFDEYGEQASVHAGGGEVTESHEYDPKDPIGEAYATLSAINEALCL